MYEMWTVTMIAAYHEARLEEIANQHSLKLVRSKGFRLHERLLLWAGGSLVSAGQSLQARYEPTECSDAYQSAAGKASA